MRESVCVCVCVYVYVFTCVCLCVCSHRIRYAVGSRGSNNMFV